MNDKNSMLIIGMAVVALLLISIPITFIAINNNDSSSPEGEMVTVTIDYSYYKGTQDASTIISSSQFQDWNHDNNTMSKQFSNRTCASFTSYITPLWDEVFKTLEDPQGLYWSPGLEGDNPMLKDFHRLEVQKE